MDGARFWLIILFADERGLYGVWRVRGGIFFWLAVTSEFKRGHFFLCRHCKINRILFQLKQILHQLVSL